jgi:hypothetical protein
MKCGRCDQEGHLARQCTWDAELAPPEKLKAQYRRCAGCQKIIYTWDAGLPCDKHRVVAEWQAYYQTEKFVTDSAVAREKIAESKRKSGSTR